MRTRWMAASVLALQFLVGGCGTEAGLDEEDNRTTGEEVDIASEEIRSVGSPAWVYDGPLPALTDPKIVVSLNGHTVRITGELPASFTGEIPFWASVETVGTKRMLTVVYPAASGVSAGLDGPGRFTVVTATPFRPNGMAYPSTGPTFVNWGGFPFMAYNGGIAFHGPITFTADGTENGERVYDWYLQRGPVSHGCNRMQGEHVVELAHLIGVDMRRTWRSGEKTTRRVFITVQRDYDRLPSGEAVDVAYPRTSRAVAPTGPVRVFRTWDGDEMTQVVCADRRTPRTAGSTIARGYCGYMPANQRNLVTGEPTGPFVVDNSDAGAFSVQGTWGSYTRSSVRTGSDYRGMEAGQSGTATFRIPITTARRARIWARYAPDTNRNTHVIYRVFTSATDTTGAAPITVNQRNEVSQGWVDLGTHMLSSGASVTVSDKLPGGAASDGWTLADSIRVEPAN